MGRSRGGKYRPTSVVVFGLNGLLRPLEIARVVQEVFGQTWVEEYGCQSNDMTHSDPHTFLSVLGRSPRHRVEKDVYINLSPEPPRISLTPTEGSIGVTVAVCAARSGREVRVNHVEAPDGANCYMLYLAGKATIGDFGQALDVLAAVVAGVGGLEAALSALKAVKNGTRANERAPPAKPCPEWTLEFDCSGSDVCVKPGRYRVLVRGEYRIAVVVADWMRQKGPLCNGRLNEDILRQKAERVEAFRLRHGLTQATPPTVVGSGSDAHGHPSPLTASHGPVTARDPVCVRKAPPVPPPCSVFHRTLEPASRTQFAALPTRFRHNPYGPPVFYP
eukprot:TRINITY_DN39423_c0_g1_i1.p1 TRINITY_DN39423_c0_g1~~TRINITY_DN39423_c0_g1_i1.p1  ORF type:complete len:354 (+),score=61.79 TRINITY_DN39423_c0_g1_i1:64-1062(+)